MRQDNYYRAPHDQQYSVEVTHRPGFIRGGRAFWQKKLYTEFTECLIYFYKSPRSKSAVWTGIESLQSTLNKHTSWWIRMLLWLSFDLISDWLMQLWWNQKLIVTTVLSVLGLAVLSRTKIKLMDVNDPTLSSLQWRNRSYLKNKLNVYII